MRIAGASRKMMRPLTVDANSVDQSNSGNLLDQSAAQGSAEAGQ